MKKLFIIAPFFPPSPLPPSQRVRLIVQHASSLGYYPVIFTVDPKHREEKQDPWMTELAGDKFELVKVNSFHYRNTRKFKLGDLGLRMLPFLFFKLRRYAKKQKPSFMLYPVPSWYVLIIAPLIKWLTRVPYGIDFIDPWVYELDPSEKQLKKKMSQWIAKPLERWACKHASIIYSVSEGINNDLVKRTPSLKKKIFAAIPYGAEKNDFDILRQKAINHHEGKIIIRYIGAIWLDCYQVLDGLMPALALVSKKLPLQIEFLGTSYATGEFAKPQMDKWIQENDLASFTSENPLRVSYKKAVELTLQSDLLLIMGGMASYYAASKLMGLLVSQKPFVAFVHKDSFPAELLHAIGFPYLVTYSAEEHDLPIKKINELAVIITKAINERQNFRGVDLSHPLIQKNTAYGMTRSFLEPITKFLAHD